MAARFNAKRIALLTLGVSGLLLAREVRAQGPAFPGEPWPCPPIYYFEGSRNVSTPSGYTLVKLGFGMFTPWPSFWNGLYYFGDRVSQDKRWNVGHITITTTCKVYVELQPGLGYVNVWNIDLGKMQNDAPEALYVSNPPSGENGCAAENRLSPSGFSPSLRLECGTDGGGDGTPPPVSGGGGDAGGGGGGGGFLRICQYTDYYDGNGNYLYTTSDGCWMAAA